MAEKTDSAAWNVFDWLNACRAMVEAGKLTRTDFTVLFGLASHCDNGTLDGKTPTVARLSRMAGLHDTEGTHVKSALSKAKRLGLIVANNLVVPLRAGP